MDFWYYFFMIGFMVLFVSIVISLVTGLIAFVGPYRKYKLVTLGHNHKKIEEFEELGDYEVIFEKESTIVVRVPIFSLKDEYDGWNAIVKNFALHGVTAFIVDERVELLKVKKC